MMIHDAFALTPLAALNLDFLGGQFRFLTPLWFLALIAVPAVVWLRSRRRVPVLLVPFAAAWHRSSAVSLRRWPVGLAGLGFILVVIALARPQRVEDKREVNAQGYDIVLSIDLSGSMLAEDFERNGDAINRLQAIKPVIQAFINNRPNDRIGIVVFAEQAYTLAPLTFDHAWLGRQVERLRVGLGEGRTAIGDGLGVALTRLEQAKLEIGGKRQGAFIILLTDGENNAGALAPLQSAAIAKSRGIPVYTIGAGQDGYVRMPRVLPDGRKIYERMLSHIDVGTLREIASTTGGRFFRTSDSDTVSSAFKAIDRSQKIDFQAKSYLLTTELFAWPATIGLAAFALAALVSRLPWRKEAFA